MLKLSSLNEHMTGRCVCFTVIILTLSFLNEHMLIWSDCVKLKLSSLNEHDWSDCVMLKLSSLNEHMIGLCHVEAFFFK